MCSVSWLKWGHTSPHPHTTTPGEIACMHCNSNAGRATGRPCMGMHAHSDPRRRICRPDVSSIECLTSTATAATGEQTCMCAVVLEDVRARTLHALGSRAASTSRARARKSSFGRRLGDNVQLPRLWLRYMCAECSTGASAAWRLVNRKALVRSPCMRARDMQI